MVVLGERKLGVSLVVRVAGLGSQGPEFELHFAELTPSAVDSACHPSEVDEMGTNVLVKGNCISHIVMPPTK